MYTFLVSYDINQNLKGRLFVVVVAFFLFLFLFFFLQGDDTLAVTIAPGVTTGELSEFFKRTNVCFKTDVILDKVTYGGVIAPGCHVR